MKTSDYIIPMMKRPNIKEVLLSEKPSSKDGPMSMKPNALEKKQMINHSFLGVFLKILGNRIDEIIYGDDTSAK